jgi:hypothetical protein
LCKTNQKILPQSGFVQQPHQPGLAILLRFTDSRLYGAIKLSEITRNKMFGVIE